MRKYIAIGILGLSCLFGKAQVSDKAKDCYVYAEKEFNLGNYDKSLKYLGKALKQSPNFGDAYSMQAVIYEIKKDDKNAEVAYKNAIRVDPNYQNNYYYYAEFLFKRGRYADALKQAELFEAASKNAGFNPKKDKSGEATTRRLAKLKGSAELAMKDEQTLADLDIQNMGFGINTKLNEYWPGMFIDGKVFVFTKLLDGQEDFYMSNLLDDGSWSIAYALPGRINTADNEGTTSVSADGRFIFYTVCNQGGFGSCDIFYSYVSANTWSQRVNLGQPLNGTHWDCQPAIGPDGRSLIFASSRPGGYGGKDLWSSNFSKGRWSEPANMGPLINTPDDDEAPYLHYDNNTLYFSSNGLAGYGQHDLFMSRKGMDGKWTTPVNLGKGINTDADEVGLYVDLQGERAYFASGRDGGFGGLDIYSFKLGKDKKPGRVSYVKGTVVDDETGKPLSANIEVLNLSTNAVMLRDSSDYFFSTLEPGGNYAFNVNRSGYMLYSENFQPELSSIDSPYMIVARLKPIKKDQTSVLRNILFDVNKFELKPESYFELNKVLALLSANPKMKIEISGHTDNTASDAINIPLSLNRANAVYNFLVSKGIDKSRMSTKGFGAGKPVADNGSAEGRSLNRRIEIKITDI